MATLVV